MVCVCTLFSDIAARLAQRRGKRHKHNDSSAAASRERYIKMRVGGTRTTEGKEDMIFISVDGL